MALTMVRRVVVQRRTRSGAMAMLLNMWDRILRRRRERAKSSALMAGGGRAVAFQLKDIPECEKEIQLF